MDEVIQQIFSTLRGMWQKRWYGLAAAWIVGMIGIISVIRMPDKYEASARIFVDTQSVLKPLMAGLAVQPNVDQQIAILSRTLISRPNVEKLIRMADMDLKLKSKEEKEKLTDELLAVLKIEASTQLNLFTVNYRDTSPEQAKKIVQSLVTIFVESGIGDKRKDSDSARKFIEEQISNYEKKLAEAENRLKEFKIKHMGQVDKGRDYFSSISDVSNKLEQARLELREAENSRDVLKRELVGEEPILLPDNQQPNISQVSMPELDGRIDSMKKSLDGLLLKYTEKHPDVVGTRKVIEQLEDQKRQEIVARKKASPSGPSTISVNNNPVYQQLKVSYSEAEASVASLKARVSEYEARYAQLKSVAQLQPELEAEFTQLNRDYNVNQQNYQLLVNRRESATMSEQMESSSAMADFRLIDPPRVSPKPVAPNRLALLPMVLLGALVAGMAISFATAQAQPTFADAHSLRNFTGLPVLGTVTLLKDEDQLARERRLLILFFAALGGLVLAYGAAMLLLFFSVRF